jgi:gamma-glutamyltranspeptidase/glutathione hydrolase
VHVRGALAVAGRRETVEAGLHVMAEGGNAVDAAVAMAFVAAVVEPTEASIGGSGFMLAHDPASGHAWSIEFPPRAPMRATPDMYEPIAGGAGQGLLGTVAVRGDANATGWLAPCVPGVVAGLCLARWRFGTLPLADLMAPAAGLAEHGFELDAYLSLQALDNLEALRASPECADTFLSGGLPPRAPVGAVPPDPPRLKQPRLGQTLRAVAADGPDAFYSGDVAALIARAFEHGGGLISRADLEAYRASIKRPLGGSYRGWTVLAPRAPSGGATVIRALELLERAPTVGVGELADSLRAAFEERYRIAGDSAADAGHGTTHLCAIDPAGRIVSCTLTAGNTFGAKVMAEGVLFDSGMAWFDPRPGSPNSIAPGKRPLVNMSPLLLIRGGHRVALGAAGGRRIISAVTQVTSGLIDRGLSPQAAISAPRLDASESALRLSGRLAPDSAQLLRDRGHEVVVVSEDHLPFSYEFARPAAAAVDEAGLRSGGIHQPPPQSIGG